MGEITLIGVDTSKQVFDLAGVDGRGHYVLRRRVSRKRFLSTIARQPRCTVVLEACASSHHWGRCIQQLGHEVRLIAPQHSQVYRRGQKNDYRDAEAVVSASLSPGMRFVAVKSAVQQAEQALHRVRSRLLRHRNATANSLRGLLAEYGVVFAAGLKSLRDGAGAYSATDAARELGLVELIDDHLKEIAQLEQRMKRYERQIEQRVAANAISTQLRDELAGVGALSASALQVKVADVREFRSARNFAAYLGFAPGHRGSGGKVKLGRLSRGHDRYLRQLLIHGARSVVSRLGTKTDSQSRWLRELVARRGFNIACVALAHKNARQAWAIMARQHAA